MASTRLVASAARRAAAACRAARAAVARHDAAAASRAARLAEAAACRAARLAAADVSDRLSIRYSSEPPDDGKCVTAEDVESDEAVWALYERFCKSYKLKRDHAEMARRFETFKSSANSVHTWNSYEHKDLDGLACAKERRDLGLSVERWFLLEELHPHDDARERIIF
uniref:Cathepsin propeptide inhibitor domain-containing protein n=1 Tax=Oryza glumipatula TaxID=40148 RepID=A0A0E0BVJ9_9ORYZ